MAQLYVLFEHAIGYSLFKVREFEEVGAFLPQVEEATQDPAKFKKVVQLAAFRASKNAISALENMNAVSEGILTDELSSFLEINMPKSNKNAKITLGVIDPKLASAISEALKINVTTVGVVPEIVRGIRFHLAHFVKGLDGAAVKQSELGLGHSYSRGKVKFNVNRVDQMIIQSISLVDLLDKDINTFAMRIREWYSYHFPELSKIVSDNYQFSKCADLIKDRNTLTPEAFDKLEEITKDSAKAQSILDAARMSMGMDISPIDLRNIETFALRVIKLSEYRNRLFEYLKSKMENVAPNLATLIGDTVGARLISHAGSLTNLAKYPASTVQILGAEKALFRALKVRGNTPKYGLIYHSSFIGKAESTNKGRISRYLANKCSLASRIDCFSETLTTVFGQKLKEQVEDRLGFYQTGDIPRKNVEVMEEASVENDKAVKKLLKKQKKHKRTDTADEKDDFPLDLNGNVDEAETPKTKKKKKRKSESNEDDKVETEVEKPLSSKKKKKKRIENDELQIEADVEQPVLEKKKKKRKSMESDEVLNSPDLNLPQISTGEKSPKKKKKSLDDSALNCTVDELNSSGLNGSSKKKKKHSLIQSTA